MTDRPNAPHADPLRPDPALTAIERRLERREPVAGSPTLRHRVLMAVDDALAAPRPPARDVDDVRIPGWAWAAAAVLGIAMTAPVVAGLEALRPAETLTLVSRLRTAGIEDESLLAALAAPPRHDDDGRAAPPAIALPSRPGSRAVERRRLLEEML
jgi:hypothetical protein